MFGSLSNANDSADSASILAVSVYPGSPPETSQRTDLPPPSPRKLTLNQLFARCAALGPSPLPRIFNKRSRVGLNWAAAAMAATPRSEEHTSELQSLMRISYAVFCLKKKNKQQRTNKIKKAGV